MVLNISTALLREKYRRDNGASDRTATFAYVDPNRPGFAWVRFRGIDGNDQAPVPRRVLSSANIEQVAGNVVIVGIDNRTGEEVIKGADIDGQLAAGFTPTGSVETVTTRLVSTFNFDPLKCFSQSTETVDSTIVSVYRGWYLLDGAYTEFTGVNGIIDLAPFIPAAGLQAWVVVGLTREKTLEATSMTPVSTIDPIDREVSVQEAIDELSPGTIPVWGWLLANAQTFIDGNDLSRQLDLRPFLAANQSANIASVPTVIERPTYIGTNRQTLFIGAIQVQNTMHIKGQGIIRS